MKHIIDKMRKIEIEHHYAVQYGDLQNALQEAYRQGFQDSKNQLLLIVKDYINDTTIKGLLIKAMDETASAYDY